MRILFSCRPAFGHVYPLIPLAMAACEAQARRQLGDADPWELILTMFGDVPARRTSADLVPPLADHGADGVWSARASSRRRSPHEVVGALADVVASGRSVPLL